MKFGQFDRNQAAGVILAHSLRLGDRTFKKGRVLDAADLRLLTEHGIDRLWGAVLAPGDLDEATASARLAALLAGHHLEVDAPKAGHCDLRAGANGLLRVDADAVTRFNRLDPEIKLATAPAWSHCTRGEIVARLKIIPFGLSAAQLERAAALLGEPGMRLNLAPYRPQVCHLIHTCQPHTSDERVLRTRDAIHRRLARFDNGLAALHRCPHSIEGLADSLQQVLRHSPDLILIAGATATTDFADVVPMALQQAGVVTRQHGFPLEPGSLLQTAETGKTAIMVLPGCARGDKPNGIDRLLQRHFCGHPAGSDEVLTWGCGGLLAGQESDA